MPVTDGALKPGYFHPINVAPLTCKVRIQLIFNTSVMKANMGTLDRIARVAVAAVLVVLFLTGTLTGTLAYVLLAVAAVFLLTSVVSVCPLYSLFGFSTCPVKKAGS